jgi:hypothetical protein
MRQLFLGDKMRIRGYIFDGLTPLKTKVLYRALSTIHGIRKIIIDTVKSTAWITYDKEPDAEFLKIAGEIARAPYRAPQGRSERVKK